jgi:hypothetical protein
MKFNKVAFTLYLDKIAFSTQTVTFARPYFLMDQSHLKEWLSQVFHKDKYMFTPRWSHIVVKIGNTETILDPNDIKEIKDGTYLSCSEVQRSGPAEDANVFASLEDGAKAASDECMEALSRRAVRRQEAKRGVACGS